MNTVFRWALIGLAGLLAAWLILAFALTLSPEPTFTQPPAALAQPLPTRTACVASPTTQCWPMRDGTVLAAQWLEANNPTTIVLLHGVMSSSAELSASAAMLREATGANVLSVDLRGHGNSEGRPGDIDYVGQYEVDVSDMVAALRQVHPNGRVILAGHSMGGGIILRYAAQDHAPTVDGYLLFAPHLGPNSPTSQPRAGAETQGEPNVKVHLGRTVGLLMLNALGVTSFNHLGTLYFNVLDEFPIQHYSYRAMVSAAPDDHQTALTADEVPMLVIVGENDEAFVAERYPEVIRLHPNSQTLIVEGESHSSILTSSAAIEPVQPWLGTLASPATR